MSKSLDIQVPSQGSIWELLRQGPLRVSIIGSGNWGSAVARIIGHNTKRAYFFEPIVRMWVFEEIHKGKKLTDIINTTHINEKYLPGIKLPENVVAEANLIKAVEGAHLVVFVMPHQFIQNTCKQIQGHLSPGCKAISLVKGFDCTGNRINLISEYVKQMLQIECCSMSGANIAEGVAREEFSESTLGFDNLETAQIFQQLFDTPYFRCNAVPDVAGVELCGALKNIVAIGAGFCDGLGYGSNTKAAIIRIGLQEMRKFAGLFYHGVINETFWDSAGVADLITTCFGGRNRRCAAEFVKTKKSWVEIEKHLLNGQKLQGIHTARDVYLFLKAQGKANEFPLFSVIYEIADCDSDPKNIVQVFMHNSPSPILKQGTPVNFPSKL